MLKGSYDLRAPSIVKFSQESESARLKNHHVQKYRKNPLNTSTVKIANRNLRNSRENFTIGGARMNLSTQIKKNLALGLLVQSI